MNSLKNKLLIELVNNAYFIGNFELSSGSKSTEYLDCRNALSFPKILNLASEIILQKLDNNITAIGGLSFGADPISISVSQKSTNHNKNIKWFSIRKEQKHHGKNKLIEGNVTSEDNICIVDDVITSGKSIVNSLNICKENNLNVKQIIILINRSNNLEIINNIKINSLFNIIDIKSQYDLINNIY